jgi:hypothetical protein
VLFALTDFRGIAEADRVAPTRSDESAWQWAWVRGREQEWREAWRRIGTSVGELGQVTVPLHYALLLGPTEDSAVVGTVQRLERMARGDATPRLSPDDEALARCWLATWRLRHGDTTGARATRRYLESDENRRYRFAGWARLIDVLLAEVDGGDVRTALLAMDSVMRDLPMPYGWAQWDPWPAEVQNLVLARMLPRYGEPDRALAAVRRRPYVSGYVGQYDALPEYLREEGRLAAMVGDTAGAIEAYQHYLALREDPDRPWRAQWDSVKVELTALVAR